MIVWVRSCCRVGALEHHNEAAVCVKGGKFCAELSDCQLVKEHRASRNCVIRTVFTLELSLQTSQLSSMIIRNLKVAFSSGKSITEN